MVESGPLIYLKGIRITTEGTDGLGLETANSLDRIVPGTELSLQLDLESLFPATIYADSVTFTLTHSEPASASRLPLSPPGPDASAKSFRHPAGTSKGRKASFQRKSAIVVQRSPSVRSEYSVASEQSLDDGSSKLPSQHNISLTSSGTTFTTTNGGDGSLALLFLDDQLSLRQDPTNAIQDENWMCWAARLRLKEVREIRQDRSLNSVRIVCRNAEELLTRKDSAGSALLQSPPHGLSRNSSTSSEPSGPVQAPQKDECAFSLGSGTTPINPGANRIVLRTIAGPVGSYNLARLSVVCFEKKLEIFHDHSASTSVG